MSYIVQTHTTAGWYQLHRVRYITLMEATSALQNYVDTMFVTHKVSLPTNIFRFAKVSKDGIIEGTT